MDDHEILRRRIVREQRARKTAESFAEAKTRELYETNLALQRLTATLQQQVEERTLELRKVADEAITANHVKSLFLSNVSHELRTPLNAIIGYGELLTEELSEEGERTLSADAAKIVLAARHLYSLVNDLLDLQKIEAGKLGITLSEVEVCRVVREVTEGLVPALRGRNNTLMLVLPSEALRLVTDELRLRQILYNLLSNAAKFTTAGTVSVRVRPERSSGCIFEVEDSGVGMSPEQVARLFTPYVQVDDKLARKFGGTGLGLALTKRLCELLGGSISVDSEAGRGSCFRVSLPHAE